MQSSFINLARHSMSSCSASRRLWCLFAYHRQHPPAKGGQLVAPTHLSLVASASSATAAGEKPSDRSHPTQFPGSDPAPPDFEPSPGIDRPPGTPDPGFPRPPPSPVPPEREFSSASPPDATPPESPPNVVPPDAPEMPPPLWPPEDTPPGFMFF